MRPEEPPSLASYRASLSGLGRERFEAIATLIARLVPDRIETFKYDMPAFDLRDAGLIYAAVWKAHIGLYPIRCGSAPFEALIAPFRSSKDIVKLLHKSPLPLDIVQAIITERLKGARRGADGPDARRR